MIDGRGSHALSKPSWMRPGAAWVVSCLVMAALFPASVEAEPPTGEEMLGWIETFCAFGDDNEVFPGVRQAATETGHRATTWLVERLEAMGIEEVRREAVPMIAWEPGAYSLVVRDAEQDLSFDVWPLWYTSFVKDESVDAPLLYVGTGGAETIDNLDFSGRIVVADMLSPVVPPLRYASLRSSAYEVYDPEATIPEEGGHPFWHFSNISIYHIAAQRGAAGFIAINIDKDVSGRFYPNSESVGADPAEGTLGPLPALCVNNEEGDALRRLAMQEKRAVFVSDGKSPWSETHNVVASLPGQSSRIIQISSHSDGGAVNDGTGAVSVLALAQHFAQEWQAGRPLRHTLQFVITGGHFASGRGLGGFVDQHRDGDLNDVAVNLTIEHIGNHYDLVDGALADSGLVDFHGIFCSEEEHLPIVSNAIHDQTLERTLLFSQKAPVSAGSGEGWGWSIEGKVPSIWHISGVQYMQSTLDTVEKVATGDLEKVVNVFLDLVTELDNSLTVDENSEG